MHVVFPRWLVSAALAGLFLGCGGSSSETPAPLPPHPLNDPYRIGGVRDGKRTAARASAEPPKNESEPAKDEGEPAPQQAPPKAPQPPGSAREGGTWGTPDPAPLPELSPH